MVRRYELDEDEQRRRRRRVWFILFVAIPLVALFVALLIVWRLSRLTPEPGPGIYIDNDVNAAIVIRLARPDGTLSPLLTSRLGAEVLDDETKVLREWMGVLVHPRVWAFARGGDEDYTKTELLVVTHFRRFASITRRLIISALEQRNYRVEHPTPDTPMFSVGRDAWLAVSPKGVGFSNAADWAARAAGAQRYAVPGADTSAGLDGFARRLATLDPSHDLHALARMNEARRQALRRILEQAAEEAEREEARRVMKRLIGAMTDSLASAEAIVDFESRERAVALLSFEATDASGAERIENGWKTLREAVSGLIARAGIEVGEPARPRPEAVSVVLTINDFWTLVDRANKAAARIAGKEG